MCTPAYELAFMEFPKPRALVHGVHIGHVMLSQTAAIFVDKTFKSALNWNWELNKLFQKIFNRIQWKSLMKGKWTLCDKFLPYLWTLSEDIWDFSKKILQFSWGTTTSYRSEWWNISVLHVSGYLSEKTIDKVDCHL